MLALVVTAGGVGGAADAAGPAPRSTVARVYLVQGVTDTTWTFDIDDEQVEADASAKTVSEAIDLEPGRHTVSATRAGGAAVSADIEVKAGQSLDVVLHRDVDASGPPLLTAFTNDLAAVPAGEGRLAVAHTAAAPPADIRVDGQVLFSDVALGEELVTTVPSDTYSVAVVPAATSGPAVLGPVDLTVEPGRLNRVYAIGVAEKGTMDAVVHTIKVPTKGAVESMPRSVPGGDGGAAGAVADQQGRLAPGGLGLALLLAAAGFGLLGMRRVRPGR